MMDLLDALRYLQKELLENFSYEKQAKLDDLMQIVYFLQDIAEKLNDKKIILLLEDFHYALAEISMGAKEKGELAFSDIEKQLSELEKERK